MGYPPVYGTAYTPGVNPLLLALGYANKVWDALLSGTSFTLPAACYAQLHTGPPGAAGISNGSSDVTREQVLWNAASGGAKTISNDPSWGLWSASSPEIITWISFWDSASTGNFIGSTQLVTPVTAQSGDPVDLEGLGVSYAPLASLTFYGLAVGYANKILDALLSGTSFTLPAASFVQLHTGCPDGTGNDNISSTTTREAVTWNAAVAGSKGTAAAPTWPAWAGTSPEILTAVSFWDAASSGNFVASGPLLAPVELETSEILALASWTFANSAIAS